MRHYYGRLHDNDGILGVLSRNKSADPSFTVIDVGASANPWTASVLDATFDNHPNASAKRHFHGDANGTEDWKQVLEYVEEYGRFSYAVCTHTLEDLAYPMVALDMLPRIAEAGYVAVPSHYRELTRGVEGPWRGYIHHRWMFFAADDTLGLAPKIPYLEYSGSNFPARPDDMTELRIEWQGHLKYSVLNNGYLGPNIEHVRKMYDDIVEGRAWA